MTTSTRNNKATGLVLEGGGFRGMYTAGILDAFLEKEILFDYLIGVSAGAAHGISYVSGQYQRNLVGNHLIAHKQYCGLPHLIKNGDYFNWEFVYKTIPQELNPFDYDGFNSSSTQMKGVLTDCSTGMAKYIDFKNSTPDQLCDLLSATSALPFISRILNIDNQQYLDGGIADSIPFKQAFSDGNKRVVVVLTRPDGYQKQQVKYPAFVKLYYRRYPKLVDAILQRADQYNEDLRTLKQLEASGIAFVIRPEKTLPIDRLERKPEVLENIYHTAYDQMKDLTPKLEQWLKSHE